MRKLIYWVHASVDGHIDGPNGEFDWAALGPELAAYAEELNDRADTLLYGRAVWEMMAGYWPNAESMSTDEHDLKYAPIWRETPKVVFSRTLERADWNTRVVSGNLADEVAALKAAPGRDLLLTGGSTLAGALTDLGLIDEYHITVHPVVLGGGRPLFRDRDDRDRGDRDRGDRVDLRLVESRTFDGRTVLLRYEPATVAG